MSAKNGVLLEHEKHTVYAVFCDTNLWAEHLGHCISHSMDNQLVSALVMNNLSLAGRMKDGAQGLVRALISCFRTQQLGLQRNKSAVEQQTVHKLTSKVNKLQ